MEKSIDIDGLTICYSESGPQNGAPIILMHGWGCSYLTLVSIENLLNSGMHVFNIDFPGHGKSTEPETVWGVEDFARMLEKFIKRLNLDKAPMLLGHSFGGRVAIFYSSSHPEVEKVLLVDAAGIKPHRSMKYYLKVYSFKTMKKILPLILGRKKSQEWIERFRGRAGSADYNAASPKMRAVMSKVVNQDLKRLLPSISASTLLIWGENDTATPLSDAKIMEKMIPDAGLVAFPGCGHYSFLDNPGGFAAVVREFLKNELK